MLKYEIRLIELIKILLLTVIFFLLIHFTKFSTGFLWLYYFCSDTHYDTQCAKLQSACKNTNYTQSKN